jgi:flagellar hook protein FlgE
LFRVTLLSRTIHGEPPMSLYSALTASASGMAAQTNKLAAVSDNIANVNTTGYKRASAEFEALVNQFNTSSYNAAGVATHIRNHIIEQGDLIGTSSTTDLAIQGNGFFVVADAAGGQYLTRAGAFVRDASGDLVNAVGFKLLGYKIDKGATTSAGKGLLEPVNVLANDHKATPSTTGIFTANLDSEASVQTGNLPSTNTAPVTYTAKSSLVTYDNLGAAVTLDLYFSKTAENTWEAAIYNAADSSGVDNFPYANPALVTSTLDFSPADGTLTGPTSLSLAIPDGQTVTLDISRMTQLASPFAVSMATTNGHAPSILQGVNVHEDGTLSAVYTDGNEVPIYTIPLANVPSPDRLKVKTGGVYQAGLQSGDIVLGTPGLGGLGAIQSSRLELSTVDLATELADMIVAQRSYQSNTKVFQTGSQLLEELVKMLT